MPAVVIQEGEALNPIVTQETTPTAVVIQGEEPATVVTQHVTR